ncbi:helix-turn-helix transcriptional regulator, partial [Actinocatenispora comari]|uniref:helix-turn-helix transcriptional regulator n=1 Tax=Actinocatenispora comari TaxID=2807577 RepID=UPI001CEC8A11
APWWFEAVTVLAEAGRPAEARPYLERGEALARRWPTPHVRGQYLLGASLLAAEPERLPLARAAVDAAGERAPALQLAARLRVGQLLLAQGDRPAAHRQLRELVADAESLGLVGLARDAATMVPAADGVAAGSPPTAAPGGQLTDCERRVAELAARGLTNRQIATELFLSTRTVEFHLTNVYRKTGVPDRHRLAGLLTAADERPAPQLRLPGAAPRLAPEESPRSRPGPARSRLSKTARRRPDASQPRRSEARPPRPPDPLPSRPPEALPCQPPEPAQPHLPDTLLPEPSQPRLSAGTRSGLSEASPRWLPEA